jgi:nucleoside phosphorylase
MRPLVIVMALSCEAEPLISALSLQRTAASRALPLFAGDQHGAGIALVISGVGKVRAASAAGYLLGQGVDARAAWLNIGICGHDSAEVGTLLRAETVENHGSGKSFVLEQLDCLAELQSCHLRTVDRPDTSYPTNVALDMEAAGIAGALLGSRHRPPLACIKVVADNPAHPPPPRPDARAVKELMSSRVEDLVRFCLALMGEAE